jgi:CBS domain-containing protein
LKRLDAAETMSRYTFDLTPVDDDAFDLSLRAAEKPRWSYIGMARGLPYQTVMPEWTNIGGRAINIDALWRWDNDRRRVRTEVSGPLSTSTRVKLAMDSKREVWNWQGVETAVRSDQLAARLDRVANSRWTWRTGAIVGRRPSGISLKYDGGTSYDLLRIPERRLVVGGELHAQLGRTFSSDERIGRAEAEMRLHWNPQPSGSDYAVLMRLRSGRIWGTAALDELFAVGVDRDDDLWLRGHAVVRDGRKGTGVVTRRYVLLNSEISKEFLDKSFVRAAIVPFVDIARAGSSFVDAGAELRVSIASLFTFSISLGRDLKAGRNVLFTNVGSSQTIH